ncbi:MAG: hypothetical protein CSA09_01650 [Candidatus Contendobacter odensis]|uniref:non-specific serine/threonine protein kinase n=1 Tax=Candidatus Contendibacter odensensis TaxID=1400860 RepID=A0A2G6PG81_9GAMM|nr:MAG: hypothetical protein CSA09_01650 [Candidatus Contendobacter odensis]
MERLEIPGYQIKGVLGKGAMSTVYLAVQRSLNRPVALKVLAPKLVGDSTFHKRFIKEGLIVAKLTHPNIVTIYDIDNYKDYYYMAMEHLEARTLKDRIQDGLTPEQAKTYLCQIARALGYAHQNNCIHRDIKPANILFRDKETAVLSDFGIAKNLEDKTQLTAVGWRVGTPNYMSPEQALGQPLDARCDLYSLGILFYEMLTGKRPYQGRDAMETALMHVQAPLPELPQSLDHFQPIINRLLEKRPKARCSSAEELLNLIETVKPKPQSTAFSIKHWLPWVIATVVLIAVVIAHSWLNQR